MMMTHQKQFKNTERYFFYLTKHIYFLGDDLIYKNIYLKIALFLNNELYEKNNITYSQYVKVEEKILKQLRKGE